MESEKNTFIPRYTKIYACILCAAVNYKALSICGIYLIMQTCLQQDNSLTVKKMIDNIPTPLVSFAGSGFAGFFMGMFLRRILKFLAIIIGSFLGVVFLVIQWMQARQYIQGQVDWNRVGNDTMAWFQSLSAQVSGSHIFGTSGIPATSGLAIGLVSGLVKS
jgi:uncharacterized membrane protein (Fun14 family)